MKLIPIADDLRSKVEIKLMGCVTHLNRLRTPAALTVAELENIIRQAKLPPVQDVSQKNILNRKEAAEYLAVSVWTLNRLRARGLIKACGGTRHPKYRREELDRYFKQNSF